MTKRQQEFFAAAPDLESLMRVVEANRQLQFVKTGLLDTHDFERRSSLLDIPGIRRASVSDPSQAPAYLVARGDVAIRARPIPQRGGGLKYALDQLANPETVVLRLGGISEEGCLLAGQVGTASANPDSVDLYRVFCTALVSQFTKMKSYYFGNEAAELLERGWRLTSSAKSPRIYDLRRD